MRLRLVGLLGSLLVLSTMLTGEPTVASAPAIVAEPEVGHVDPSPPGVDMVHLPSTAQLLGHKRAREEQADGAATREGAPPGSSGQPGLGRHVDTSCTGTGADGRRVQVLYVVEADDPDRFPDLLPVILDEVANVDDTIALSADKTGGGRRVRWVFDPATCVPVVDRVVVPVGTLGVAGSSGGFDTMRAALLDAGRTDPDRKYLVFADAAVFCGVAAMYPEADQPVDNPHDGGEAMFARVDAPCWQMSTVGVSVPTHELMHTLGAVQSSAPHGSGHGHCTDESDRMCYSDALGLVMSQRCPPAHETLLDCGNDDYFHTSPPAGSYLATHWNPADSSFLDRVPALTPPPSVTLAGPSSVRPGLAAVLTASSNGPGPLAWAVDRPACLVGGPSAAELVLQCPTNQTGTVRADVTYTTASGMAATASRTLWLGAGTDAALDVSLAASQVTVHVGQTARLTARVRSAGHPVRAVVSLSRSRDGVSWTELGSVRDAGSDGAQAWTVRPRATTQYRLRVLVAKGSGWRAVPAVERTLTVRRWPVSVSGSATGGLSEVVVRGQLLRRDSGQPLAGRVLALQRRAVGSATWTVLTRRTTGRAGRVAATVRPTGTLLYRWVFAGSQTYARGASAAVSAPGLTVPVVDAPIPGLRDCEYPRAPAL